MSSAEANNKDGDAPGNIPSSLGNKHKSRVSFSDLTTIHYIGGDSNQKDEDKKKSVCEDEEKIELPMRCRTDEVNGKNASFRFDYENTEMFKLPQTSENKSCEAIKLKKRMMLCDSFYSSDAASFTTDTDFDHHHHHGNNDMRRMTWQLHNRHHQEEADEVDSLNQFEVGSYLEYLGAAKRSRLRRKLSRTSATVLPRRHHRNPDLYGDEDDDGFDVVNLTLQIGILLLLCYTLYKKV